MKGNHSGVDKSIRAAARFPGFKSQFYHLLAPSLGDNNSTYLVMFQASILCLTHDKC